MNSFLILTKDNLFSTFKTKKGIIFLVIYLIIFLALTYLFFNIQDFINSEVDRQGIPVRQQAFAGYIAVQALSEVDNTQTLTNFLIRVPFINIALFLVTIIGTPVLILILSYDKVSQEVYDGTLRYLLFRTSRAKIYFAKFFSGVLEVALITFIALFFALAWGSFKLQYFDFTNSLWYEFRFWLIAQPWLWVFVSFSLLFSSIFKKPFQSLIFSFLGFFTLVLLPLWVQYISPVDPFYMKGLLFDFSPVLFTSLGYFCLFTIVFLSLGYFIFNRKDL